MLDWLYGPRHPANNQVGYALRNLTIDVDTLFDLAAEIPLMVERSRLLVEEVSVPDDMIIYQSHAEYLVRGRQITQERVRELGIPDRNQLELQVRVAASGLRSLLNSDKLGEATVSISSQGATIMIGATPSPTAHRVMSEVADYLYKNGTQRPDWEGARWVWWLVPIPIAVGAWIWAAFTVSMPLPIHLLILAVLALASFSSFSRARIGHQNGPARVSSRSIEYRGESRKETQQRRADTRQNLKVALYTAPVAIAVGWIGALLSGK